MNRTSLTFAGLSLLCFSAVGQEWSHVNKTDEFTDEKVNYVMYRDNEHHIQLSHQGKSNRVFMFITRNKIGTIEPNSVIDLRVDSNKTNTIDPNKLKTLSEMIGEKMYEWQPDTIAFAIWHGKPENNSCGFIGELINGKELKIRYAVDKMTKETYSFSLEGAAEHIANGLGVPECLSLQK